MEIIKLGILYFFFLSSHGIRAKRENLIFGRSCFIPISFSAAGSPSHRRSSRSRRRHCCRRLFGKLFSGRKPQISKRTRPIYPSVATPPAIGSTRAVTRVLSPTARRPRARRVSARAFFSGEGTPHTGSSGAVLVFIPPAVQPEPSLSTFWPFLRRRDLLFIFSFQQP